MSDEGFSDMMRNTFPFFFTVYDKIPNWKMFTLYVNNLLKNIDSLCTKY